MNLKLLLKIAEQYEEKIPPTMRTPLSGNMEPDNDSGSKSLSISNRPTSGIQVIEQKPQGPDKYGLIPEDYVGMDPGRKEVLDSVKTIVERAMETLQVVARRTAGKKEVDRSLVTIRKAISEAETLCLTNLTNYVAYGH
jgi:hypothetical protein